MCTVVFIPGQGQCQLASLRDENPMRPKAHRPSTQKSGALQYLAPLDALAGGTWVGLNQLGHVVVLLNGGYRNHSKQSHYRQSRGLVVPQLLGTARPIQYWAAMDLEGTEPFTLVVWGGKCLHELVWDGQCKTTVLFDSAKPHIWSSATLYDADAQAHRKSLFHAWMAGCPIVNHQSLLNFFATYRQSENGFLMNRNPQLQTLSYSFVEVGKGQGTFSYQDFTTGQLTHATMPFDTTAMTCPME